MAHENRNRNTVHTRKHSPSDLKHATNTQAVTSDIVVYSTGTFASRWLALEHRAAYPPLLMRSSVQCSIARCYIMSCKITSVRRYAHARLKRRLKLLAGCIVSLITQFEVFSQLNCAEFKIDPAWPRQLLSDSGSVFFVASSEGWLMPLPDRRRMDCLLGWRRGGRRILLGGKGR